MSMRTWLGAEPKPWADYNLSEYPSMELLCEEVAWKMPAKAYSPTRELMAEFLMIMENSHQMSWDEFAAIEVGEEGSWEDYCNTPTNGSIRMMEMFEGFLKAVGEELG
jgi:hypothetical protein